MSIQDPHATTFGAAPPEVDFYTIPYPAVDYMLLTAATGIIFYLLFAYLAAEFGIGISP